MNCVNSAWCKFYGIEACFACTCQRTESRPCSWWMSSINVVELQGRQIASQSKTARRHRRSQACWRQFYTQVISVDPRQMKLAYKAAAGRPASTACLSGLARAALRHFHPSYLPAKRGAATLTAAAAAAGLARPQCSQIPQIQPLHHARWRLSLLLPSMSTKQRRRRHSIQRHAVVEGQTDSWGDGGTWRERAAL